MLTVGKRPQFEETSAILQHKLLKTSFKLIEFLEFHESLGCLIFTGLWNGTGAVSCRIFPQQILRREDNEVQAWWQFSCKISRPVSQRQVRVQKGRRRSGKKWIFHRDVKVFLDGKKSFVIKNMEILRKKYAEFRKNYLCRAKVMCKGGVIVLAFNKHLLCIQSEDTLI